MYTISVKILKCQLVVYNLVVWCSTIGLHIRAVLSNNFQNVSNTNIIDTNNIPTYGYEICHNTSSLSYVVVDPAIN